MKTKMLLAMLAIGCAADVFAQDASIEIRSLSIVRSESVPHPGLARFGGTTISLLVTPPSGFVISLDKAATEFTTFKDDLGKDLPIDNSGDPFRRHVTPFPRIAERGKTVSLDIYSPEIPSKGAKTITVKGSIALTIATRKQEHKTPNVAFKEGTTFTVGPFFFRIVKIGKPSSPFTDNAPLPDIAPGVNIDVPGFAFEKENANKIDVTLETEQDLASIADIGFLDNAGKPLDASRYGSGSKHSGDLVTNQLSYLFKTKPDTVTIVIQQWTDTKTVIIPLNLTVGLGL